jgi:hypothetical protein
MTNSGARIITALVVGALLLVGHSCGDEHRTEQIHHNYAMADICEAAPEHFTCFTDDAGDVRVIEQ